jgi:hypothetical protein
MLRCFRAGADRAARTKLLLQRRRHWAAIEQHLARLNNRGIDSAVSEMFTCSYMRPTPSSTVQGVYNGIRGPITPELHEMQRNRFCPVVGHSETALVTARRIAAEKVGFESPIGI